MLQCVVGRYPRHAGICRRTAGTCHPYFRDHAGNQLAWAERTVIANEVEPLQRFLRQETTAIEANSAAETAAAFKFIEVPRGTTWDRTQARILATVFVTILATAGFLCALARLLSLYRRVVAIAV